MGCLTFLAELGSRLLDKTMWIEDKFFGLSFVEQLIAYEKLSTLLTIQERHTQWCIIKADHTGVYLVGLNKRGKQSGRWGDICVHV